MFLSSHSVSYHLATTLSGFALEHKVSEKKTTLPNLVYSLFTSTALYLDYGT
jgi:hypothetical protein